MIFEPRLAICFAIVADKQSFTGAAELMGLSQPSVSEQIAKLERQLGFAVFLRSSRRVELTAEGATFLPHAQRLAHAHDAARTFIDMVQGGVTGQLRLGAIPLTLRVPERVNLIERFVAAAPSTRLEIFEDEQIFRPMLRQGEIDAFIGFVHHRDQQREFEMMELHHSIAHLLVPAEHRLGSSERLSLDALAGETVVTFPRHADVELFDQIYTQIEVAGARLVEAPEATRSTIEAFARARRLITLKWRKLQAPHKQLGDMVGIPIAGAPITSTLALFRKHNQAHSAVDMLWNMAAQYRPTLAN